MGRRIFIWKIRPVDSIGQKNKIVSVSVEIFFPFSIINFNLLINFLNSKGRKKSPNFWPFFGIWEIVYLDEPKSYWAKNENKESEIHALAYLRSIVVRGSNKSLEIRAKLLWSWNRVEWIL